MSRNWKKKIAKINENGCLENDVVSNGGGDEVSSNGEGDVGESSMWQDTKTKSFTPIEEALLLKYLTDYRDGAERVCFPTGSSSTSSKEEVQNAGLIVGDVDLPVLTKEVLSEPYMSFPEMLTSKQRRFIHELCIDVGLYHCSVGPSRDDRYVAISIHSDGFEYLPEKPKPPATLIPLAQCRPWYLRMDDPEQATKHGLKPVYELFDQPSQCLRDGVDTINFSELEDRSLATISAPSHDDHWMLVDTSDKMRQCAQELSDAAPREIGFDMEMYNPSKYVQVTCLLQITSNAGKEYVIDTLAPGVWDLVSLLAPLFADPNVVKIGHCIGGMDVKSLHLDYGIFVVNAFDTFEAARVLRLPSKGLAAVCQTYGLTDSETYAQLKADHQRMDWRKRPLSDSMILYGRSDVHYLIELRRLMIRDLTRRELWDLDHEAQAAESHMVASSVQSMQAMWRQFEEEEEEEDDDDDENDGVVDNMIEANEEGYYTASESKEDDEKRTEFGAGDLRLQADLMTVLSKSQQRCLQVWTRKEESPHKNDTFLYVVSRAASGETEWTESHMKLYGALVLWRNTVADEFGALPGLICSLDLLARIAEKRPTSEAAVRRISLHLPDLLEEKDSNYITQLISTVRESVKGDGLEVEDNSIRTYKKPPRETQKRASDRSKLFASMAIIGTIAVVALIAARQKRR